MGYWRQFKLLAEERPDVAWRLWPTSNVRFYPEGFSDNPATFCEGWEVRAPRALSSA